MYREGKKMRNKILYIVIICFIANIMLACSNKTTGSNSDSITPVAHMQIPDTTSPTVIISPTPSIALSAASVSLPEGFSDAVFGHIEKLCSFGERYADSKAEEQTVDYVSKFFSDYGIAAETEQFSFHYFSTDKVTVTLNGEEITCTYLFANPYKDTEISGEGVIYSKDSNNTDFKDKIVLADVSENLYQLTLLGAKAVLILESDKYNDLVQNQKLNVNISFSGSPKELTSENIIGTIVPDQPTDQEIIISAHWDSIRGPGASDNASGVGELLELAKYFSSIKDTLPCKIRFVALGAEELGCLGSQAYVSEHSDELQNCIFDFNIDEVGGDQDIWIETKSDTNHNGITENEQFACQDYSGSFILNSAFQFEYDTPDWLKNIIDKSCNNLNLTYQKANGMGSDHTSFAEAGVPSTNICVIGEMKTHSPDDAPGKITKDSLNKVGEIVTEVIRETIAEKCR